LPVSLAEFLRTSTSLFILHQAKMMK